MQYAITILRFLTFQCFIENTKAPNGVLECSPGYIHFTRASGVNFQESMWIDFKPPTW